MKYLQSKAEIASGELTIKGTRILIADVIAMLAHGHSVDQLHKRWPHVSVAVLRGALQEATQHLSPEVHA